MSDTKQTLKAEKVGDFSFIKERNGFLTYNKAANVDIKVGKSIETIRLHEIYKYNSGERNYSIVSNVERVFINIYDIGITIDISDIIDEYKKQYQIEKEKDTKIRLEYYKNEYRRSWVHRIPKVDINGLEILITSEDKYLEGVYTDGRPNSLTLTLKYNNVTTNIGRDKYTHKYTLCGEITKHRKRSYKSFENLAEKFVMLVDFLIESKEAAKIAKINQQIELESKMKHLTDNFQNDYIKVFNGRSYWRNENRLVNEFYLQINEREIKIKINGNIDDEPTYNIERLDNLTKKQVIQICKILK